MESEPSRAAEDALSTQGFLLLARSCASPVNVKSGPSIAISLVPLWETAQAPEEKQKHENRVEPEPLLTALRGAQACPAPLNMEAGRPRCVRPAHLHRKFYSFATQRL